MITPLPPLQPPRDPGFELHPAWREFYGHLLAYLPRGVTWHPPLPPYFTGYNLGILYDWDQFFEAILLSYCGFPCDYARNGVRIFLDQQHEDGYIRRSVNMGEREGPNANLLHKDHIKPFLAQIVWLCRSQMGLQWLQQGGEINYYERLKRYFHYWCGPLDVRGVGLSVWRHAAHSGMDNHYERAGNIDKATGYEPSYCEGIDLNSYLVREAQALALIAAELGHESDAQAFLQNASERSETVRRQMWDDDDGMYYDYHAREGRLIKVKYAGVFAALWAGIPTPEQASRLVTEHLLNEREFWRPWPLPAYAATEPGYLEGYSQEESTGCCSWRAHTWIPTNYYTFQGLRRYKFDDTAKLLAEKTYRLFMRGRFNEYYTSESGVGTGQKPFWGWTGLALFMEAEHFLDVDPTALVPDNLAVPKMRNWLRAIGA